MQEKDIKELENSVTKRFRTSIWRKFIKGISEYDLIQENDSIGVCISGGKDSMLMALCFKLLQKHWKVKFNVKYIVMDPGYKKENRELIYKNANVLGIEINIFNSPIFEVVNTVDGSPCYLCARMRRGYLYNYAKSLGCNKIALGHHFNDVVETVLISMFYGSEFKTMMPKLKSTNHEGMELIRPMYLIKEDEIIKWKNYNELSFLQCACRFTEQSENKEVVSKRKEIKELIKNLKSVYDKIDENIFKSIHKVNLDTVLGYIKNGEYVNFLDNY